MKTPQKILETSRKWRANHKDLVRKYWDEWEKRTNFNKYEYKKQYRLKNLEWIKQYLKEYYLKNRTKIIQQSIQRLHNLTPKQRIELNQQRRLRHVLNPEKRNIFERIRDSKLRSSNGSFTKEEWESLFKKYNFQCFYCNSGENLTIDHAVPLKRGGSNNIDNILPACYQCNVRKRNLTHTEFIEREREYLDNGGKLIFPLPELEII